ncbi:hypothetical protein VPH35_090297 [Triticum aestivum]|uniref:glutamate receptor 2.8 n=1 Tax=Triticum aestivum TaxID=4565 RepID=UPI00043CC443|nr:glutamate receptor 2.8-like [Triticum aestivum]
MERASQITFFLLLIIHSGIAQNATTSGADEFPVGVILNLESLRGKMARTSLLMALEDFYTVHRNYSPKVVLHIRDSKSNSVEAASAALDLLENYNVQAIIGPQTSSQAAFVSDLGNKSQKYDIAIGDITISENRMSYVDFALPYTESGVAMVVPAKSSRTNNTWIFVEPLSRDLWLGSIILFFYTWVVLWLLEFLGNNTNIPDEVPRKLGIMTFFSLFGDKDRVERLLSRIVLIVWVFFFLVLSASYTANLATMLTIRQLNPTITDIHELRKSGEYVGCIRGSYVERILEQLNFDGSKIKTYNTYDGFYSALSKGSKNGGIAAFIHEVPYIRLFLARNCKGYTMVPFYKAAGFGYAFPKGSPLVGDISKAILSVIGGDTINQIEKKWIGIGYQNNCNNAGRAPDPEKLTPDGFTGLFILSGVVSTSSLLIAVVIYFYEKKNSTTKTQPEPKGDQAEGNERGNEAGEEMQNIGLQPSGHRHNASAVSWGFRRSFGTRVAPVSSSSRF